MSIETESKSEQLRPLSPLEVELNKKLKRDERRAVRFDMRFLFGSHRSREQADLLKEHIQTADALFLEGVSWNKYSEQLFQDVSNGKVTPQEALTKLPPAKNDQKGFRLRFLELLYGIKKPVAFLDVSVEEPFLTKELAPMANRYLDFGSQIKFKPPVFDEAVKRHAAALEAYNMAQQKRETFMIDMLVPKLSQLFREFPILKAKKSPQFMMFLGAEHTFLTKEVREIHPATTRVMLPSPFVYNYRNEYMRTQRFGLPVREEIKRKAFLETLVGQAFPIQNQDEVLSREESSGDQQSEQTMLFRRLVDSFSEAETHTLYTLCFVQPDMKAARGMVEEHLLQMHTA